VEEQFLLGRLRQGDADAFTLLFRSYYKDLVLFGGLYLPGQAVCEDIVQSIFLKLWRDRSSLAIETSLKAFLLKSVRNSCLDEIRHLHIKHEHDSYAITHNILEHVDTENYILYSDLYQQLQQALEKLPDAYREAFEMNRFEGLKYREIAERLDVSERTVEVRISKAIERLRLYLKDFLPLLIYIGI
jgi:RNA polymerase sigma-70 factor (ECF subfamily)